MIFQIESKEEIFNYFNTHRITSFDYENGTPESFKGSMLDDDLARNPFLQKNLYYIMNIQDYIQYPKGNELPEMTVKEATRWDKDGGQCIYLSALLYCLLVNDKVVSPEDIHLCQGYYEHDCREDNLIGMMMGETHVGLHAWLELKGSIIDISIAQEHEFFDFKDKPFILGEVPEGMNLIGFRETNNTAKNYCRRIAKESGTVYLDWIKFHSQTATNMFLNK